MNKKFNEHNIKTIPVEFILDLFISKTFFFKTGKFIFKNYLLIQLLIAGIKWLGPDVLCFFFPS